MLFSRVASMLDVIAATIALTSPAKIAPPLGATEGEATARLLNDGGWTVVTNAAAFEFSANLAASISCSRTV